MEWLDRMNNAVGYIESNLEDVISYDEVAQIACCSTYHFQRMFSFITGVPLSEYIRRRRLTLAAFELQTTDMKVIDIAIKYGYQSPEAFTRAFKNLHGVVPGSARDRGVALKAFSKVTFSISIKGVAEMNYRIEEKEAFEVFGMELRTSVVNGQCYKDIPQFWSACAKDGRCEELMKAAGKEEGAILDVGVTYAHNVDGGMAYMIGCIKKDMSIPSSYTVLNIPKQTWAIFETPWKSEKDDEKIHEVWKRIYSEWFATAGYEHADCDFDMEVYFGNQETEYGVEIWIPIVKK
jgi:AraC family transcriptional regulator